MENDRKLKPTTKKCPVCGNIKLILLRSHNKKICTDHEEPIEIPWYLDKGQKALFN